MKMFMEGEGVTMIMLTLAADRKDIEQVLRDEIRRLARREEGGKG